MAQVRDFSALLEVLAKTPYADLIRPFSVTNMEDFDYTACESVLRKYFYDQVMKIVDQEFSGKVKKGDPGNFPDPDRIGQHHADLSF